MEALLKTRAVLGLEESTFTERESAYAKDLFKGLKHRLTNNGKTTPSVTFFNEKGDQETVTVVQSLTEAVRAKRLTVEHLLGFPIQVMDNGGKYFTSPFQSVAGDVDTTAIKTIDQISFDDILAM